MEAFEPFLQKIDNPEHRARVEEVLSWVMAAFAQLETRIAWNQPMFTDHGTFIFALSVAKAHMALSPEGAGMSRFFDELAQAGYQPTSMLFRIKWGQPVDYELLRRIIQWNIEDKKECATFWRKP